MDPTKKKRGHISMDNEISGQPSKRPDTSTVLPLKLMDLPEEVLRRILVFAQPKEEHLKWGWTDQVGQTCKVFWKICKELAPQVLEAHQFRSYRLEHQSDEIDRQLKIIRSLSSSSWKGNRITELHFGWECILEANSERLGAFRALLSAKNALPSLEWLDINFRSEHNVYYFPLVDAELLAALSLATPNLQKLCLAGCFSDDCPEVSPRQLELFAKSLKGSLNSISLAQVPWMSDYHVEKMLSVVGKTLLCLELVECCVDDFESGDSISLTDRVMAAVAQECSGLNTFTIESDISEITSAGLEKVLKANKGIRHLDLSGFDNPGLRNAASVIATYAPKLVTLRCYWAYRDQSHWLNDEGIKTIIDGQIMASKGGPICLKRLGIGQNENPTTEGVGYALKNGVLAIEGRLSGIRKRQEFSVAKLSSKFPHVNFVEAAVPSWLEGSLYNDGYQQRKK